MAILLSLSDATSSGLFLMGFLIFECIVGIVTSIYIVGRFFLYLVKKKKKKTIKVNPEI
jgi:hypothetical protein